jgi:hypothetical protein
VKEEKKFNVQTSVGDVMVSIFWDNEGILFVGFLKGDATVQSDMYRHQKS